ncbi:hypothetical protein Scep_015734 [Stephania cephalantha]|uniref:Ig-like domain-containing protein n=1 Tax=Stephania cephalantha TaxID=152367 RepID=A0AAP0J5Q3_9MAGN
MLAPPLLLRAPRCKSRSSAVISATSSRLTSAADLPAPLLRVRSPPCSAQQDLPPPLLPPLLCPSINVTWPPSFTLLRRAWSLSSRAPRPLLIKAGGNYSCMVTGS